MVAVKSEWLLNGSQELSTPSEQYGGNDASRGAAKSTYYDDDQQIKSEYKRK